MKNRSPNTLWKRTVVWAATMGALILALSASSDRLSAGPAPGETGVDRTDLPFASRLAASAQEQWITCSQSGFLAWTTTSSTGQIVRQCTLTVPTDGSLFISTDGSLVRWDGPYGVQLWAGVDSTLFDMSTTRWVDVYDDADDGTDKSIALSVLKPVTAGTHTVYVMASRVGGPTGTVMVRDPSLSVIFIPSADSDLLACGDSRAGVWDSASSVWGTVRQCTLQIPQNGLVFLSADGTAARVDGDYEAEFRFGVDSTTGDQDTQRWINVYSDAGDGTDEPLALSSFRVVGPGEHTFHLVGSRVLLTGTVRIWNPSLTAIYIPSLGTDVATCMAWGQVWSSTEDESTVVAQCTAYLPTRGWAYVSADGSLGQQDGSYEAKFRMQVDNAEGDLDMARWVDVYTDIGDGTDKSFRLSGLTLVGSGDHTFYLMGNRSYGMGTVYVYDSSFSVFVLPSPLRSYLPIVRR